MPFNINIANIKTNGVTHNGNIDIGSIVHNSHTANSKLNGANFGYGDFSPVLSNFGAVMLDPDVSDQDQISNPSTPVANQV